MSEQGGPAPYIRGRVVLQWREEASPFRGLWVVLRRRSVGETLDDLARDEQRPSLEELDKDHALAAKIARESIADFGELVVDWNLSDERGVKLPIGTAEDGENLTLRSLLSVDDELLTAMREAYTDATTRVSRPLERSSGSTPPSDPELSLPMEPL